MEIAEPLVGGVELRLWGCRGPDASGLVGGLDDVLGKGLILEACL